MLYTMKELLDRASAENYAIAAPNVGNSVDVDAAIAAAEALNAPLQTSARPAPRISVSGSESAASTQRSPSRSTKTTAPASRQRFITFRPV